MRDCWWAGCWGSGKRNESKPALLVTRLLSFYSSRDWMAAMTVCAAFREGRKIYIGCDSGTSDEALIQPDANSKIVRRKYWCIAFAGAARIQDLIEIFDAPKPPWKFLREYVIGQWVPALRKHLQHHEVLGTEPDKDIDAEMILIVRQRIFVLDGALSASEPRIAVVGSGAPVALGVLRTYDAAPKARLRRALQEACDADLYCRRPVRVLEIPRSYRS